MVDQGGIRPARAFMDISCDRMEYGTLTCHYLPETVTEELGAEYKDLKNAGAFKKSKLFMWGEPRTLKMVLLFNEWGEYADRLAGMRSVMDSITWIRGVMYPVIGGADTGAFGGQTRGETEQTSTFGYPENYATNLQKSRDKGYVGQPPPILKITFGAGVFEGHLTAATITYLKAHPTSHVPIRATVDVTFSEYTQISFAEAYSGQPAT